MTITNLTSAALVAASLLAVGCGPQAPAQDASSTDALSKTTDGKVVNKAAAGNFKKAAEEFAGRDAGATWSDDACESAAKQFQEIAGQLEGGEFSESLYNAGIAYQRCKQDEKAKEIFERILAKKPKFHRARVQVALYRFVASGQKEIEAAIKDMQQAVTDAEFKNEEALVHLAMLQMLRDNEVKDDDGTSDFDRARQNLQRALAINDGFMPALNQLAVFYLESAKKKALAGVKGDKRAALMKRNAMRAASEEERKADSQALELAQLVCSQAIRKNDAYAPVHNTMGLISAELGQLSAAAKSFGTARRLDPKFFEAHMNYAAVNLRFRGFEEAEKAYRAAIGLRPNDFEAHLGLALAIRGGINDVTFDQALAEAQKELDTARRIDAARPETYYNEAILVEEYRTKAVEGDKSEPVYLQAKDLFKQFIQKAAGKEEYASVVKRAEERMKEIDDIITVVKEGIAAAKNAPPAPPAPPTDPAAAPAAPAPAAPAGEAAPAAAPAGDSAAPTAAPAAK